MPAAAARWFTVLLGYAVHRWSQGWFLSVPVPLPYTQVIFFGAIYEARTQQNRTPFPIGAYKQNVGRVVVPLDLTKFNVERSDWSIGRPFVALI